MAYPQLTLGSPFSWLSPPPLGNVLLLLAYWAMVIYMMTNNAIIADANYYERMGFRGGWISLTQVPLVYLLSSKASMISVLVDSSYERLNWFHRWASRTLLVTVTLHGAFFVREWLIVGPWYFTFELGMMSMVKYGLGAWAILVWTFLSSLAPLRTRAYELFVLQHIAAAILFLWVLWVHVPTYSWYFVLFSIVAISFDWVFRFILLFWRNMHFRSVEREVETTPWFGYRAQLQSEETDITKIAMKDVHFSWAAGQHIRIWIPRLGIWESHPFTIASQHVPSAPGIPNELHFVIHAKSGFTRRIYKYALEMQQKGHTPSLIAFVSGPYGVQQDWNCYETLVLIAASTGASFTLPILESVLSASRTSCVRRIRFLLLTRKRECINGYLRRLLHALAVAEEVGLDLTVEIAVTRDHRVHEDLVPTCGVIANLEEATQDKAHEDLDTEECPGISYSKSYTKVKQNSPSYSRAFLPPSPSKFDAYEIQIQPTVTGIGTLSLDLTPSAESGNSRQQITYTYGRPSIATYIRHAVEKAGGETTVAVCGGRSLVSTVRNSVASLSDERAVHKGSGAQGIHLFVEEYSL